MVLTASSVDPAPWVLVTEVDPKYCNKGQSTKVNDAPVCATSTHANRI